MITQDKRLLGGVAGAVLLAAIGGFSVARYTAAPSPEAQKTEHAEDGTAAHVDNFAMTKQAIGKARRAVAAVRAGALGSETLERTNDTAGATGGASVRGRTVGAGPQATPRTRAPG